MNKWKAEIIAIGDELTSGQRLDTNSQWISSQLCEFGIEPEFHTTVGDSLQDGITAFKTALQRSDLIVTTGGIGPTKDDLTRRVLADVAKVELRLHPEVVEHIESIFARLQRVMPENNILQAWFPEGSAVIPNLEGTAPGIDLTCQTGEQKARIFALPGVPYEMHEMWHNYVAPNLEQLVGRTQVIRHHVVNCFGAGESQIETLLGELTQRGRQPRVGITASQATISLRITATGNDESDCQNQITPTVAIIQERLGELVYGELDIELQDIIATMLSQRGQSIAIVDCGFGGAASQSLFLADLGPTVLAGSATVPTVRLTDWLGQSGGLDVVTAAANRIRGEFSADIGVAIWGPASDNDSSEFEICIVDQNASAKYKMRHGGHSGLRHSRTTKQILNQIRLHLLPLSPSQAKL